MSSRPGRFIEIVETGWSRDRTSEIAADVAFGRVTSYLWEKLRGESMKAMSRAEQAAP
jgi:NitT/TauT family transport system ATP-binding protein